MPLCTLSTAVRHNDKRPSRDGAETCIRLIDYVCWRHTSEYIWHSRSGVVFAKERINSQTMRETVCQRTRRHPAHVLCISVVCCRFIWLCKFRSAQRIRQIERGACISICFCVAVCLYMLLCVCVNALCVFARAHNQQASGPGACENFNGHIISARRMMVLTFNVYFKIYCAGRHGWTQTRPGATGEESPLICVACVFACACAHE